MPNATKELSALKVGLIARGHELHKDFVPRKIGELTKLMDNNLLNQQVDSILPQEQDLTPQVPPPRKLQTSKRKRMKADVAEDGIHSDSNAESDDEFDFTHDFCVPSNAKILELTEMLRKEWKEALEVLGSIKLSLQLKMPPIESGGGFIATVLDEMIGEASRFEDAAYTYLDAPSKYLQTRAKLAAKLSSKLSLRLIALVSMLIIFLFMWTRHRTILDFRQSLLETDSLEYVNLRLSLMELRSGYITLYDMIEKNMDKLQENEGGYSSRMTI